MDMNDIYGDWAFCVDSESQPSRKIAFGGDGNVLTHHGREKFWKIHDNCLIVSDTRNVISGLFDASTCHLGFMKGHLTELGFSGTAVWLRRQQVANPLAPAIGTPLPIRTGALDKTVTDHSQLAAAWSDREDFTIVMFPGGPLQSPKPLPESKNLGTTPESQKFEFIVNEGAPASFPCAPAFAHVLHDCWIVDGMVVVTKGGEVIYETTQFPAISGDWDSDYFLAGSDITPSKQEVMLSNRNPTATIEVPVFLFSTLKQGYGHWLGQSLPNWMAFDWIQNASPAIASELLVGISGGLDKESFRGIALDLLELKNPVLQVPKGVVYCRKLVVPSFHRSHGFHWPGIGPAFRKMVATAVARVGDKFERRIFSSRSGQDRDFTDAIGIQRVLKKHNFSPLVGGTIDYVEQVARYGTADAVFGPFGSNMCNISFCKPGSVAVEILDEMYTDAFWDYFLANASKMKFCYLVTAVTEENRQIPFHKRQLDLQAEILDDLLCKVLP